MLVQGLNFLKEWLLMLISLIGAILLYLMASLVILNFPLVVFIVVTKRECWSDVNQGRGIRVFEYAKGKRYLVQVGKEPDVPEVVNW
jgi:hypothetical protein